MPRPGFIQRFRANRAQKRAQKQVRQTLNDFSVRHNVRPGLTQRQILLELYKIEDKTQQKKVLMKFEFLRKGLK